MDHADTTPAVVLDTNVLLDWLVFRDARVTGLARSIERRAVRWIITEPMTVELQQVLARQALVRWQPDRDRVEAAVAQWAERLPVPCAASAAAIPRCGDPSDQMFVDLALSGAARWLVTRDRALLRLARFARRQALAIVPPEMWPSP
jgi:putative PIN family toxin of toxin-antitoxin system